MHFIFVFISLRYFFRLSCIRMTVSCRRDRPANSADSFPRPPYFTPQLPHLFPIPTIPGFHLHYSFHPYSSPRGSLSLPSFSHSSLPSFLSPPNRPSPPSSLPLLTTHTLPPPPLPFVSPIPIPSFQHFIHAIVPSPPSSTRSPLPRPRRPFPPLRITAPILIERCAIGRRFQVGNLVFGVAARGMDNP